MNALKIAGAIAFALSIAAAGCGRECRSTGMCARGQHCDISSGECVGGCASDSDCGENARCDTRFGNCRLIERPGLDARTSTSSPADAEAGD